MSKIDDIIIDMSDDGPLENNHEAQTEYKDQLYQLMREVIGNDEPTKYEFPSKGESNTTGKDTVFMHPVGNLAEVNVRNQLRAQQLTALNKVFGRTE